LQDFSRVFASIQWSAKKVYNPAVMSSHERTTTEPPLFIEVLNNVMSDPDYLAGTEPEGSGWDFHDWPGNDFRKFKGWVLGEKFFDIPTLDGKALSMRIVQTDPEQFPVSGTKVSFLISAVTAKGFPVILIGKDSLGNEVVLRNKREPVEYRRIPDYFQELAQQVGALSTNEVVRDPEGGEWASFLKYILHARRILPAHFGPTEKMVRALLEIASDKPVGPDEKLYAEMELTEQELLSFAYADFTIG
jgi:hypothetical protein